MGTMGGTSGSGSPPTPLCRCRVLYIGSAVPTVTKDGLQGIQQPLRERYPASESPEARGIDSWLSVWYNGLLLEYIDGDKSTDSAFFAINSLHYCAAVRYVNMGGFAVEGGGERFIPLDSPFAQLTDSPHPPIFAAIFRRTTGVKVLECHGFVCTNEKAANALVRCCFHAYADTMYLKLDEKNPGGLKCIREPHQQQQIQSRSETPTSEQNFIEHENGIGIPPPPGPSVIVEGTQEWNDRAITQKTWKRRQQSGEYDGSSLNSSLIKKGGGNYNKGQQQHESGILVPYRVGENGNNVVVNNNINNTRRTTSHTELRSPPIGQLSPDHFEHFGHPHMRPPMPPNPLMFGGPMSQPPPPPHPGLMFMPPGLPPPPAHLFRQHPHLHPSPHFFPPRPPFPFPPQHGGMPPPPHFGRIVPPPFMMRPFFMVMPPNFMGGRPKSPERLGGGPIITETAYDTFPRHNRTTYEEPIYMPSTDNTVPPQASYKPGSFSPELYEHYYETYKQQRTTERKNVMSRTDSDASADYWESGVEANTFRKTRNNAGNTTPKAERGQSPNIVTKKSGEGDNGTLTKTKIQQAGPSTSRTELIVNGKARPDTPPADYEVGSRAAVIH